MPVQLYKTLSCIIVNDDVDLANPVFIYALRVLGDTEIRYIGQTQRPRPRYFSHLGNSRFCDPYHQRGNKISLWIDAALAAKSKIEMVIIDSCSKEESARREQYWIDHFRKAGCNLSNHMPAQQHWTYNR